MMDPIYVSLERILDAVCATFAQQGFETERVNTHISTVLLVGDAAYKFKKPVDFGFLDFSTLAQRAHFCQREVLLNRRFAPDLYKGVVPITRGNEGVALAGTGSIVEYAVWMRRFEHAQQLDVLIEVGNLATSDIDALGRTLGALHLASPRAAACYATAAMAHAQVAAPGVALARADPRLQDSLALFRARLDAASPALAARHEGGFIRDCHGDLHASNIVRLDGHWTPFDCIEFNDELRFIDSLSDFAFLLMDFEFRAASSFANSLRNAYLQACGDYGGLILLPLYCAYRSLVRALVAELERQHTDGGVQLRLATRRDQHIALAAQYLAEKAPPRLLIMHGLSGSGKSWLSRQLAAREGQIVLRSDIERRRLNGVTALGTTASALNAGIYRESATVQTYAELARLGEIVITAGYSVIIDAAFLHRDQRAQFRQLAEALNRDFEIINCAADPEVLKARISTRAACGNDPSEANLAVLAQQMSTQEPLTAEEWRYVRP